jgi:hypothetical protein
LKIGFPWGNCWKSLTALTKLAKTYCLPVSAKLGTPLMNFFATRDMHTVVAPIDASATKAI